LDLGATTPETIALSIVSEIQAVLAGRSGGSFSRLTHG
jgi:xanthine/CO dehydrogenase XdhC/CoxF family maturation factor